MSTPDAVVSPPGPASPHPAGTAGPSAGGAGPASPVPDAAGHFGQFGGQLAPEALMSPLAELTAAYLAARSDPGFQAEFAALLRDYAAGRRCSPRCRALPPRRAGAGYS